MHIRIREKKIIYSEMIITHHSERIAMVTKKKSLFPSDKMRNNIAVCGIENNKRSEAILGLFHESDMAH